MTTRDSIVIPFAEWLPDLPDHINPGATVAKNVIPQINAYLPLKALSAVTTTAMTAFCRGAMACFDSARVAYNYGGDATKLYVRSGVAWTDVTNTGGAYALASGENWEFIVWGQKIIAVAIDEPPQVITMGGANFADLGGTPPKARHIAAINNFVVVANLDESGTLIPNKVRWSGINNEATWTASASTQSDSQLLYSDAAYGGGWVMKVVGGAEHGYVFQEYAIWRMSYVGTPTIFDFDVVSSGIGTPAKNSVVTIGEAVLFLGQDGFYMLSGNTLAPLSHNKISATFFADLDISNVHRVVGAVDPKNQIAMWIYPSTDSDGTPDKAVIYDYINKKWSQAVFDSEWIYSALGIGYTLETLDNISADIDALPASLDSDIYKGGSLLLGAVNTSHNQASFSGTSLAATVETAETEIIKGRRSLVDGARPLCEGSGVTLTTTIKTRNTVDASVSASSAISPQSTTGICPHRSEGRYHRVGVSTSGDFEHLIGVEVFARPTGQQ